MKKTLFLLLIVPVLLIAGCIGQTPTGEIKYSNDIISVKDYSVSNRKPYANSSVTIEFYIKNSGDEKVNRTKVDFYDIPGVFSVTQLECDYGDNLFYKTGEVACEFRGETAIDSLDERKISITLKAPPSEDVPSPLTRTVSYSIEYDYPGYRIANIPVIDGKTRTRPLGKFSQSDPSYGPIVLEFELIPKTEVVIDKTITKEYWAVPNQSFEVTFSFKDVVGKARKVNISKENININITSPLRTSTPCNLDNINLKPIKDVLVPETKLMCYFVSSDIPEAEKPETTASIKTEFNYTYKFETTETFTIQPPPK